MKARKKRKAGKAGSVPAEVQLPGGRFSRWERVGLPALGVLALGFAWLAALGGVSDGSADWRRIFLNDTLLPIGMFRDLFLDDDVSASGWWLGGAPYYVPAFAIQWPLFALGMDWRVAMYLYSLLQAVLAVVGWILVCDFLFGKSPARRAAVVLAHAATFLLLAWRESNLFVLQLTDWHYCTWTCLPWLLWFALRMLDASARSSRGIPVPEVAALVVALAVMVASDLVVVPWFAGPVLLAALFCAPPRSVAVLAAALGAGVVLGRALYNIPDLQGMPTTEGHLNFSPTQAAQVLDAIFRMLGDVASRDPFESAAMLAFAAAVAWRIAASFRSPPDGKKAVFRPRLLVLLFVPASVAAPVAAQMIYGAAWDDYAHHPIEALRYQLPMIYFPLFVGWALLPGRIPKLPAWAASAALAAVVAVSVPKAAKIDFAAMDPYGTPFQQCFAENANRLGWTGGIATFNFVNPLLLDPDAGIKNHLKVVVYQRPDPGQSAIVEDAWASNFLRARPVGGEFQFVVVNARDGRFFYFAPRAGDRGCALSANCPGVKAVFALSDRAARGAFGEPAEIVECAGVGFYHYDPPLRFNLPENRPVGTLVGRF